MRETEDELVRNMLGSTASVINCTGGNNGDMPTEVTRSDIDTVVLALLGNDAMMISDNIDGTLKFGTAPIREAFWGMMSTQILDDLEAVTGFINQAQYPSNMNVLNAELTNPALGKPFLIGLEVREDDKAQAELFALAA